MAMQRNKYGGWRDYQRKKVYDSNSAVYGCNMSLKAIELWVEKISTSRWWKAQGGKSVKIKVKDGRRRIRAGAWVYKISMPRWTRNQGLVMHELAHCLTIQTKGWSGVPDHGATYCRNYIRLVRRWMGKDWADKLIAAFKKNGVRYRVTENWK